MKKNIFYYFIPILCWFLYVHGTVHFLEDENNTTIDLSKQLYRNALPEKPFVIVITSRNNAKWYQGNLDSVFTQSYSNYRVIYLDDASTDNTPQLVEKFIKEKKQAHRVTLVRNTEWLYQMANHYRAAHMCQDDEIIVHLDGDDRLHNPNVLNILNQIYSKEDVWITHGQPILWPSEKRLKFKKTPQATIDKNSFRHDGWFYGHLRSCYAWLFKQIKLEDLMLNGSFKTIQRGPDIFLMYPMLEMAGKRIRHMTETVYIWNRANPGSQKGDWKHLVRIMERWPKYQRLSEPKVSPENLHKEAMADIVILCQNNLTELEEFLEQLKKKMGAIDSVKVIFTLNQTKAYRHITNIEQHYPLIQFTQIPASADNIVPEIGRIISECHNNHILLCSPCQLIRNINLNSCIKELEKTGAYCFYLNYIYATIFKFYPIAKHSDTVFAFQHAYRRLFWRNTHPFGMHLYRKDVLLEKLQNLKAESIDDFKQAWCNVPIEARKVGLIFKDPCIHNPPIDQEATLKQPGFNYFLEPEM